jgi:hypothetical protein
VAKPIEGGQFMKNARTCLKTLAATLVCGSTLALNGCGGGGGDALPVAAPAVPVPATFTVAGTAATGAALDGATITITGSDGTTYPAAGDPPVVTGTDGSYTVTLPLTAKPPFVVTAVRDDISLVSVVAEAKDATTNITPVTNLIASRLSSSGDPTKLAAEILADPTLVDLAKVTAKVAEVVALIKPVMDAAGTTTDPLNGNIQADVTAGTGADKLLDSLAITITPSSASTVNIEVAVKQQQTEGEQPASITFTGGTDATTPEPLPAVTAANLVPSGNAELIADFLQRVNTCYALPQAERVASGGTAATDIIAAACKDIFFGKDASSFLNNGAVVSSKGAYSYIFGADSGVTLDRGSYEFTRATGDLVIGFRGTSSDGVNSSNYSTALRADTDGKLRAIGNQYKYDGAISAAGGLYTFVNQPAASYYYTGYSFTIANSLDANGNPIFAKVVVTSPKGNAFTLMPRTNSNTLRLVKNGVTTGTVNLRLSGAFVDPTTSGSPADADPNNFVGTTQFTDAEIAAIPAQGTWQFDYYLASDPASIAATQYYKTRARAMTIAEWKVQPLAALTDDDVAYIKANSSAVSGVVTFLPAPTTGPVTVNWTLPTGAVPVKKLTVFGNTPVTAGGRVAFDNTNANIASSALTGSIACTKATASDTHCDSAGNYAANALLTLPAILTASDGTGRDFMHAYALYWANLP